VPFFLPEGSKLPQPSGYTPQGIPYYRASSLLDFSTTGEQRDVRPHTAQVADSIQRFLLIALFRKLKCFYPGLS